MKDSKEAFISRAVRLLAAGEDHGFEKNMRHPTVFNKIVERYGLDKDGREHIRSEVLETWAACLFRLSSYGYASMDAAWGREVNRSLVYICDLIEKRINEYSHEREEIQDNTRGS